MDYLLHGIPWNVVQRMMLDAPSYDTDDHNEEDMKLTQENASDIMNYVNNMM